MIFKKGKKLLCNSNCSQREESEYVKETTMQTPKLVKKEGKEVLHALEQRLVLHALEQPMVKTMVSQAVPLQPMEVRGGADIHLQPTEDPTPEQVGVPKGDCDPMENPRWSSLILKGCTPWKGPTLEQFMKNCSLWKGLALKKFLENCLPWEGPHVGVWEECEESFLCRGRNNRDNV